MTDDSVNPRINLDEKLEAEIEAALGEMDLEDMLDLADSPKSAADRGLRTGTIVSIRGNDVFVEFGPKSQGVCPLGQFSDLPEPPQSGQRMQFLVDRFDADEGLLILSRQGAVRKAEWESLDVGQVVEARCTGTNKGGLELEVANHPAFMPAGQVDLRHVEDLTVFVGEKLPCEVIELDRQRGRIILSRRSALEAERAQTREKLLESLEEGAVHPAVITTIKPYGAFADLGGIDGLIHISEMSYERIKDPSEVVKVGDQVEVKVLTIDRSQEPPRVALGLKQLQEDPYEAQVGKLEEGSTVSGRVTRLAPFGAFVELAPGMEGLIHISELSHERVHKVSHVVKEGEIVNVKILSIDPASRRIGLSIKALRADPKSPDAEADMERSEDPRLRKLKAQLSKKFGDNLKGGIG